MRKKRFQTEKGPVGLLLNTTVIKHTKYRSNNLSIDCCDSPIIPHSYPLKNKYVFDFEYFLSVFAKQQSKFCIHFPWYYAQIRYIWPIYQINHGPFFEKPREETAITFTMKLYNLTFSTYQNSRPNSQGNFLDGTKDFELLLQFAPNLAAQIFLLNYS